MESGLYRRSKEYMLKTKGIGYGMLLKERYTFLDYSKEFWRICKNE